MSAEQLRNVLLRRWWLITVCVVLALAGALAGGSRLATAPTEYQSTVSLEFGHSQGITASYMATIETTVATPAVLNQVAAGFPGLTSEALLAKVSVSALGSSQVLRVTVTDEQPQRAAELATAIANVLIAEDQQANQAQYGPAQEVLKQQLADVQAQITTVSAALNGLSSGSGQFAGLQSQLSALQQRQALLQWSQAQEQINEAEDGASLFIVDPALPGQEVKTTRLISLFAKFGGALLFGLIFGGAIAYFWDRGDQRVHDARAVGALLAIPALATLDAGARALAEPDLAAAHALESNLAYLGIDRPVRTLVLASATEPERASEASAKLARALSAAGKSVVLVDANLRNPTQAARFGIQAATGLSNAALAFRGQGASGVALGPYLTQTPQTGKAALWIMSAGPVPPNPAQILRSRAVSDVCKALADGADLVLFDAPAALDAPDALLLANHADGLIIVVDLATARRDKLALLRTRLSASGANVLGYVLVGGDAAPVGIATNAGTVPRPVGSSSHPA
jgi:Mrp family chromosome partitioning ATPase